MPTSGFAQCWPRPWLAIQPRVTVLHAVKEDKPLVQTVTADDGASPFLEPLLRGLLLGASCGILCEVLHVSLTLAMAGPAALFDVFGLFESETEEFAPLFLWDHVAALSSWTCFYVMESAAVLSVLHQYGDDPKTAGKALDNTVTLPKRMLPVSLASLKRLVYYLLVKGGAPTLGLASASATIAQSQTVVKNSAVVLDRRPSLPETKSGSPEIERARERLLKRKPPTSLAEPSTRTPGLKPGEYDPDRSTHSKRQSELLARKSYLRNFWYAAALSENLVAGKLLKVEILGRTVVLFRDEAGKPQCLDNICPHRGAPLSSGWLKEVDSGATAVVCPYHGWAFDCSGKLREVPSASSSTPSLPRRSLVDAYPVEEQGGFIWLFFGSKQLPPDERPPIPYTPELDDPRWKAVYGEIEFDCPHWGVFENAIDMAHIHYLHGDSFGNSLKPAIEDMTVKRSTFDITASFSIHNKPVSPIWEFTAVEAVPVTARAMLPSSSAITIQLGAGVSMITFVNTVPINANRAVNRFCLIRNFAGWEGFDAWARQAMFRILNEDKVMVEQLKPEKIRAEVSLEPDRPQIAFRKLRQEWIDMGYGVLPEMTESCRGSLDM